MGTADLQHMSSYLLKIPNGERGQCPHYVDTDSRCLKVAARLACTEKDSKPYTLKCHR